MFLNSRRARGLSPETIRWYKDILERFARACPELPESADEVEEFLADCGGGDERRHGYFRALRAMYRFLRRRSKVPNPLESLDPPKRSRKSPRALTPDELDQLLAYPHAPRVKAALLFLVDTGCRVGELFSVSLSDLSSTAWGYTARVTGKTGTREVPVSYEVYTALQKTLPFRWSRYRLRRIVALAFQDAHVKGTAHTLRHTFGTLWRGDELVLQRIMGHAHLSTTRIYRQLATESLSKQHAKYSPLKTVFSRSRNML